MDSNQIALDYERAFGPFIHMAMLDKAIWIRYLEQGGTQFAPFEYDIRVGDGVNMPPTSTAYDIRAAKALTTKRIDVVCSLPFEIRIIEVKQRAGLAAIGQLIGYADLYQKTYAPQLPLMKWLVTDELQPDMANLLDQNGIHFVEVG